MTLPRSLSLVCLLFAMPAAHAQTRVYCCNDANGQRICGDTLPQACYARAYKEQTPSGRTLKEVEAPMTAEQRAIRDAEIRALRERAEREAEMKRRDRVLLDSYANVLEIDARRDREVANVESDLNRARAREADLKADRVKLEKLKPASGPIPRDLVEDLETNSGELAAIRSVIASKQRDIEALKARFNADRDRYLLLKKPTARQGP